MQKEKILIFGLIFAMTLVLPMVLATTTLNVPVTGTNYTTLTVNCTTDVISSTTNYNVSIYYNASGGAAGTLLNTITNTSASQTEFTASPSIESLTDGTSYNFTCYANNGTDQEYATGVTSVGIDNTNPTYTFVLSKPDRADYKGTQRLTWTTTDATSGVETVSVSVESPNTDTCANQSWTDTSGSDIEVKLDCTGTYTAYLTVTDNAGNVATTSDSFKVYAPGYKDNSGSEGTGSFSAFSIGGEGDAQGNLKIIAIIVVIVLVFWLLSKK